MDFHGTEQREKRVWSGFLLSFRLRKRKKRPDATRPFADSMANRKALNERRPRRCNEVERIGQAREGRCCDMAKIGDCQMA